VKKSAGGSKKDAHELVFSSSINDEPEENKDSFLKKNKQKG